MQFRELDNTTEMTTVANYYQLLLPRKENAILQCFPSFCKVGKERDLDSSVIRLAKSKESRILIFVS